MKVLETKTQRPDAFVAELTFDEMLFIRKMVGAMKHGEMLDVLNRSLVDTPVANATSVQDELYDVTHDLLEPYVETRC